LKVGAENRKEVIAAVVLMVIAALLLMRMVFSSSSSAATPTTSVSPVSPVPQPTDHRTTTNRVRTRVSTKDRPVLNTLDPRLRLDLLKSTEDTVYEGRGRNIFRAQEEIPQPVAPAKLPGSHVVEAPPGPPPPPPINLKFYGFANKPGEPKRIFLSKGEDVFIAREGEIVDHRYKIVRINMNSVEVEDVLSNNRQSIPLTPG
jgi:hypothetical protein